MAGYITCDRCGDNNEPLATDPDMGGQTMYHLSLAKYAQGSDTPAAPVDFGTCCDDCYNGTTTTGPNLTTWLGTKV